MKLLYSATARTACSWRAFRSGTLVGCMQIYAKNGILVGNTKKLICTGLVCAGGPHLTGGSPVNLEMRPQCCPAQCARDRSCSTPPQGRLISARRRSLRSSHRPAGLEARFLKEPDRASASTPLEADRSDWLRTVAEVDAQSTKPGLVRRILQHLQRQHRQKATARQQIEPHVNRDRCHHGRWQRQFSAAEQVNYDTTEK